MLRKVTVVSMVPAAPLDPDTPAVRAAAGHDRVVAVVAVDEGAGTDVPPETELEVGEPRVPLPLEDDTRAHPPIATTATRASAARRPSIKN